jgi:hypothetical protein
MLITATKVGRGLGLGKRNRQYGWVYRPLKPIAGQNIF